MPRRHRPAPALLPAFLAVAFLAAILAAARAPLRLVAIADVHGAYPELLSVLQKARVIDSSRQWTGGTTTLVQTGDLIDRGVQTRDCLDLLMALERQSRQQGGRVIALVGNHEVMNLMGDVRYVTPEIFGTFAAAGAGKIRDEALRDYVKFLSAHRGHSHTAVIPGDSGSTGTWMDAHPLGFEEYRDAFGPQGRYGRWIRAHHAVVQIGDVVFVHGGLNPALEFAKVRDLDDQVISEIAAYDSIWRTLVDRRVVWRYMTLAEAVRFVGEEMQWLQSRGGAAESDPVEQMQRLYEYRKWLIASPAGPLWYRGLADGPEDSLAAGVQAMLDRLQAKHVVIGHTVVSKTAVTTRFGTEVILLDTGMLKEEYGGRASGLEIKDGQFTVYYGDGATQSLPPSDAPIPAARPVAHAQRKL